MITIKKKEKVEELFNDQTVEFDKKSLIPNMSLSYYTKFNGKRYCYQFHKENNEWLFGFSDENYNDEINNNSRDITYQVFNGAIQAIKQFVDEYNPEKFVFSSNPLEPSRTKLYQMLIKKMESWFKSKGFSFEAYDDKEYGKEYHFYSFTKNNRIDELNLDGYKHIKNNDWDAPGYLIAWLQDHNFEMIGQGRHSKIYSSNEESFIVKINKGKIDNEYLEFIKFCQQNKGNPHLPKLGKIKKYDNWYIIFIEKLEFRNLEKIGIFDEEYFFSCMKDLTEDYLLDDSGDEANIEWERIKRRYNNADPQLKDIAKLMAEIITTSNNISLRNFDLHDENIMMRGDTIVITDPLWEGSGWNK